MLRARAGLSQEGLGRSIGVSFATVSGWERDVHRPDIGLVPAMADALTCQPCDFFHEPGFEREPVPSAIVARELAAVRQRLEDLEARLVPAATRQLPRVADAPEPYAIPERWHILRDWLDLLDQGDPEDVEALQELAEQLRARRTGERGAQGE